MAMARSIRDPHAALAVALAGALALAVLWGVDRFVGWRTVAATAARVGVAAWLAFCALLALSYGARVLRLWRLLHDVDARVRASRVSAVFFVHNALATLMPARLGEAAMPLLARRWLDLDWAATVGALAWWRLSDLAVVAALALGLLAAGARVLAPLYALALAACAVPFAVFVLRIPLLRWAQRRGASGATAARGQRLLQRVLRGMPARPGALLADLGLAFAAWSTKLAAFAALMHGALTEPGTLAASTHVPPLTLLAAAGLAGDVGGALPMPTLGGIGPFEAGVGLGLAALQVDARAALAIGVTLHGAVLLSIAATGVIALGAGLLMMRQRA